MTTYLILDLAKKAVVRIAKRMYGVERDESDFEMVWFAHILGNKKLILYDWRSVINHDSPSIYEVTYNETTNELYVDAYDKALNMAFAAEDLAKT